MVANSLVFPGDAATLDCQIRTAPNLLVRQLAHLLMLRYLRGLELFEGEVNCVVNPPMYSTDFRYSVILAVFSNERHCCLKMR